jgi:putative transposase
MKKVPRPEVVTTSQASESPLPAEIQEALGELVGAAREGLLALSVGVGLRVVHELMEAEVDEVVGPKGKWNPDRTANRHGHEDGSMTLGGRRVPVTRPRVRSADDQHELPVATYEYFAARDPLARAVMDRMLAGVSTRRFARVAEPVGEQVEQTNRSKAKSTVSEMFIEKTRTVRNGSRRSSSVSVFIERRRSACASEMPASAKTSSMAAPPPGTPTVSAVSRAASWVSATHCPNGE